MTAVALVVAEDTGRREAIAAALAAGFRTVPAEGGLDALKRLQREPVDCVVASTDLVDMGVDGFVDRVRDDHPDIPVVLVGEPREPGTAVRALKAGAFDLVSDPDHLPGPVERAVTRQRATVALDRHRRLEQVLHEVCRDVVSSASREEIEQSVYDRLVAADLYQVVCIGEYGPADPTLTVHLPVPGSFPVPSTEIPSDLGDDHIFERAVDTGEVTVADVAVATRGSAAAAGTGSTARTLKSAAVPFVHADKVHGVALVSTARARAFDTSERALLGELGDVVGFALSRGAGDEVPDFVQNLVHELRNPVGIATAHLEIGREQDDPAAFDRVEEALREIEDLIDDIAKVTPLDHVETTLREFSQTATDAWAALDRSDAELIVAESTALAADHDLLERLLSNLFRNAVEHAGDDVTVRVGMTEDGFFVEDDGVGIPETDRDRVFQRGVSSGSGLGIGLSLVADIAEAHGWTVDLRESEDGGARFEFSGVEFPDDAERTSG